MIKVLLKRRVKPDDYNKLLDLLKDLRGVALHQPGYLTGETLVRGEDPVEVLAIGSWVSEEHWKAWSTSQQRIELEDMVSPLLVERPEITIYSVPAQDT